MNKKTLKQVIKEAVRSALNEGVRTFKIEVQQIIRFFIGSNL